MEKSIYVSIFCSQLLNFFCRWEWLTDLPNKIVILYYICFLIVVFTFSWWNLQYRLEIFISSSPGWLFWRVKIVLVARLVCVVYWLQSRFRNVPSCWNWEAEVPILVTDPVTQLPCVFHSELTCTRSSSCSYSACDWSSFCYFSKANPSFTWYPPTSLTAELIDLEIKCQGGRLTSPPLYFYSNRSCSREPTPMPASIH